MASRDVFPQVNQGYVLGEGREGGGRGRKGFLSGLGLILQEAEIHREATFR